MVIHNRPQSLQLLLYTVTGAFKAHDWTTCRSCDDSYHLKCLDPPLEYRPDSWKCPVCKERKRNAKAKKEGKGKDKKEDKESKPLFEGEHDDDCFMCFNGGGKLHVVRVVNL